MNVLKTPNRSNDRQPPIGYAWRFKSDPPGKWRDITFTLPVRTDVDYVPVYEETKPLPDGDIRQQAMQYLTIGVDKLPLKEFDAFCRKVVFGINIATGPIPESSLVAELESQQEYIEILVNERSIALRRAEDLRAAIYSAYHNSDLTEMRKILYAAIHEELKAEVGSSIEEIADERPRGDSPG